MVKRTPESERSSVSRRHLLYSSAVTATIAVSGCLDGGFTSSDDTGDGSEDEAPGDPLEVVHAYLQAAADSDTEEIDSLTHSEAPFNPAELEEEGWEFQGGDGEEVDEDDYEAEVRTEDGSVDDILELEGAELWFAETDLEADLEDEQIALVDLDAPEGGEASVWVLVVEDEEWRVFLQADEDDTPENLEDALEEPIEDEDNDVVEEIDWEYEQPTFGDDDGGDNELDQGYETAQVVLTDSRGVEADRVRIESTMAGAEIEYYDNDDGEIEATWTGTRGMIQYDPDGDQITVTAIDGDEETVVHREHYEP